MNKKITPLAKAKSMGSAHSGVHHWWHQRLTAIFLVALFIWLFAFVIALANNSQNFLVIIKLPYNTIGCLLFILTAFYHAALGMRVIIEDYVPSICWRYKLIIATQLFTLVTVVSAITAIVYLIANH